MSPPPRSPSAPWPPAAIAAFGAGAPVRAWFGLTPEAPAGVSVDVVLARNLPLIAGTTAAGAACALWPRARPALDVLLAALLALNAGLVGAALGAYGTPLLRLIGPHLALEVLAAAIAGGAYLAARRHPGDLPDVARVVLSAGALAGAVTVAAAVVEARSA